ncbi:uncharacterized protein LOC62_02G002989 [Vanrija pseudolonga]|uniref:Structure-specific endonuclease subunit SLX4 n=1 Tax=Vanrija pseudolonga TaxID=143232 RepID=A0AAF1BGY2_9TREE|nr:hypothetical protein LOC62_02G002989 [Vanrija pseudolonga]
MSDDESFLMQAPPAIGLTQVAKDGFKQREEAMERRTEEEFNFLRATQVPRDEDDEDEGGFEPKMSRPTPRFASPSLSAGSNSPTPPFRSGAAAFRETSVTPKAAKTRVDKENGPVSSPHRVTDSPALQPEVININSTPDDIEADEPWENGWEADGWGGDAVLIWEGDGEAYSSYEVSSVAPSEAGVSENEWGADATLTWDGVGDGLDETASDFESNDGASNHRDDEIVDDSDDDHDDDHDDIDEEPEYHDIDAIGSDEEDDEAADSPPPATSSAMPDYKSWDTAKLQRLAKQYGYRSDLGHAALVKVATNVWAALHPPDVPASRTKGKGKGKNSATATIVRAAKQPPAPRRRAPKKQTTDASSDAGDAEDADMGSTAATNAALDAQFHAMIVGDKAFWLRILRYEPIAFDEMVSRGNVAGIKTRGWKNRLKRFLDLKGIIYYTSDPTGPRRRR